MKKQLPKTNKSISSLTILLWFVSLINISSCTDKSNTLPGDSDKKTESSGLNSSTQKEVMVLQKKLDDAMKTVTELESEITKYQGLKTYTKPIENNLPNSKLIDSKGVINGLIFGDSLYSKYYKLIDPDELAVEIIFGNHYLRASVEDIEQSFVYGIPFERFSFIALNGKIIGYVYQANYTDFRSTDLIDSLNKYYGIPDLTFNENDYKTLAWKGRKYEMDLAFNTDVDSEYPYQRLRFSEIKGVNESQVIQDSIDTFRQENSQLDKIFGINLPATKTSLISNSHLIPDTSKYGGYISYSLDYENIIKPFFKIEGEYSNRVDFLSDTLYSINVSFDDDLTSAKYLYTLLGSTFGTKILKKTIEYETGHDTIYYWLFEDVIITLTVNDDNDDFEVEFDFYFSNPFYNIELVTN